MVLEISRRQFLARFAGALALPAISGCGTFLYPERRGQHGGQIDWKVVALDGIGLLLFFIPGVIAFAVDITTGAIYLPPHEYRGQSPAKMQEGYVAVELPKGPLSHQQIAATVYENTGKQISLEDDQYKTVRLPSLKVFQKEQQRFEQESATAN